MFDEDKIHRDVKWGPIFAEPPGGSEEDNGGDMPGPDSGGTGTTSG